MYDPHFEYFVNIMLNEGESFKTQKVLMLEGQKKAGCVDMCSSIQSSNICI